MASASATAGAVSSPNLVNECGLAAPTMPPEDVSIDRPLSKGWFATPFWKRRNSAHSLNVKRWIPVLSSLPPNVRSHFVAMVGEFTGTFLFLMFALGGAQVVNTAAPEAEPLELNADPSKLLFISLCFGLSLLVNAWVFFRVSGGLFNPAVTVGMCLVGAVSYLRGILLIFSQILGAIASSAVVSAMLPGKLSVSTTLGGGASVAQGVFIEMFLTAQLVLTIFMLAVEKHRATFLAPVGIGLSLFIAEMMGIYYTGGAVNPARAFGPCVVNRSFPSEHWIYWVGPILGAAIASYFYLFLKALDYQSFTLDQDHDGGVRHPHHDYSHSHSRTADATRNPSYLPALLQTVSGETNEQEVKPADNIV